MYRVIQWATGGVGKAAIQGVLRHPDLELVGCWVHSADKSGRDVGELAGEDPIGVLATNDIDELLALDHPWIQEYFRGPRGRAAVATQEAQRERSERSTAGAAADSGAD